MHATKPFYGTKMGTNSMDSLETIFSIQKELASMMDLSRYPASIEGRVSALSTAIVHEAIELQRLTNWKWWKKPTAFDSETAKVYGVKTDRVEMLFSIVLAIVVISAMNSIGVTLLAAAIIAPAISARLITNNFSKILILSTIIGIINAFLGMYSSFYIDSPSGATIVLFGTASFIITIIYSQLKKLRHIHFHGEQKHSHLHTHSEEHRHEH